MIKVLLLAIVLSMLLIIIKNNYSRYLYSKANFGMQAICSQYGNNENNTDGSLDIFLGSSMFRKGLDINVLEDEYSKDAYILSYNGNQPFEEYFELQYLINAGVTIDALFIDMYAYSINADPWISDDHIFVETDIAFKISLCKELSYCADFGDYWTMFVASNNEELLTYPISYQVVNRTFYRGGSKLSSGGTIDHSFMDDQSSYNGIVKPDKDISSKNLNDKQVFYLEKIVNLCKENSISVTFIETPKFITTEIDSDYKSIMYSYALLLEKLEVPYYLTYDMAVILSYNNKFNYLEGIIDFDSSNAELFIDYIHLSEEGRVLYTQSLCDAVGNLSGN